MINETKEILWNLFQYWFLARNFKFSFYSHPIAEYLKKKRKNEKKKITKQTAVFIDVLLSYMKFPFRKLSFSILLFFLFSSIEPCEHLPSFDTTSVDNIVKNFNSVFLARNFSMRWLRNGLNSLTFLKWNFSCYFFSSSILGDFLVQRDTHAC